MGEELRSKFESYSELAKSLPPQSNEVLLKLYAYFKQATIGDVQGKRPGLFDLKARLKYDAWMNLAGLSKEEAMQAYIDLVDERQKDSSDRTN